MPNNTKKSECATCTTQRASNFRTKTNYCYYISAQCEEGEIADRAITEAAEATKTPQKKSSPNCNGIFSENCASDCSEYKPCIEKSIEKERD